MSGPIVHYYLYEDPRCTGEMNLCGGGDQTSYSCAKELVTCPQCFQLLGLNPSAPVPVEPAVEALKSYARLSVLAERERICKLLEATIAEIRKGE